MIYVICAESPDFSADFTNFWYEKTDGKLCDFEMKELEDYGCTIPVPWHTWIVTFNDDNSVMDFINFIHSHREHIRMTMGVFEIALKEWQMRCIIKSQAPNFFNLLPEYYNRATGKTLKYIYADLPDDERRIPMSIAVCNFDTFLSFIAVQARSIKEDIGDFSIRITTKDTEETKTDDDFTIGELKRAWTDRPEVAKTLDNIANTLGRRLREEQISEQDNADVEISKVYAGLSKKKQKEDYELLKEYSAKSNEFLLRAMARKKKPFHRLCRKSIRRLK